ncbi:PREDICTED: gametocyte-specific factor 1-like [Trachymyrmex cornetzi]|uniref:gametocyte-specific factor 1-like n=1 Tax=Trachymyrmex cornetzi TaxID=471704 RepID=UPI00084F5C9F|nr:PREDICTED: gametocyte-specific factor 1-like [Trachymyrmex cornetzi]
MSVKWNTALVGAFFPGFPPRHQPIVVTVRHQKMNSNNDEVLHCPYNNHHRIASSKFQRHLVKCEKNFPPDYKVICPYNATHRLNKSEIEEHINTCPMRRTVEGSYIQSPTIPGMIRAEQNDSTSQIYYNSYCGS